MNSNLKNPKLKEMLELLDKNRYSKMEETIELAHVVYEECKKENHEPGMAFALLAIGQAFGKIRRFGKKQLLLSFIF